MPNNVPKPAPATRLACRMCVYCDVDRGHVEALAPDKVAEDHGWGPLAPHLDELGICHGPDARPEGAIVFKNDNTYRCMWYKHDPSRLILADDRKIAVSVPGVFRRGKK